MDWQVEFLQDPDGDVHPGDILVSSELMLPASPELGVGERTRRITTVHVGQRVTTRQQVASRLPEPSKGRVKGVAHLRAGWPASRRWAARA